MSLKETKIYAIVNQKCPRCHEGDLFIYKNPYKVKHLFDMNKHCQVCGFNFEPETGFYYGAMYSAYALSVAISVGVFLVYYFGFPVFDILTFLIINAVTLIILFPITFRLSRALWINLLFGYEPGPYDLHKH